VLGGDTVPCAALDGLCTGADAHVQKVIRDDLISQAPIAWLNDVIDYHPTVVDVAQTAARAGVGTLVLNHCAPTPMPGTGSGRVAIAAEHLDGEVLLPDDLDRMLVEPAG
jgi:ribonuclease Z